MDVPRLWGADSPWRATLRQGLVWTCERSIRLTRWAAKLTAEETDGAADGTAEGADGTAKGDHITTETIEALV